MAVPAGRLRVILACMIIVHVITVPEPGQPKLPDRPWRVFRGQGLSYGPPESMAAGRTFGGAGSVVGINSRGTMYVRETPDQIDGKPCHEANLK